MGTYIAVGLLLLLLALVGALVSQRRAYVRDAAAIGEKESKLAQLTAERLQREKVAREHESDAAVERALNKREKNFDESTATAFSVQSSSEPNDSTPVPATDPMEVSPTNRGLSERELELISNLRKNLGSLVDGMSNKEISDLVKEVKFKEAKVDYLMETLNLDEAFFSSSSGVHSALTEQVEEDKAPFQKLDVDPRKRSVLLTLRENIGLGLKTAKDLTSDSRRTEGTGRSKILEDELKKKL